MRPPDSLSTFRAQGTINLSWTPDTAENEWCSFNVTGGVSARARRKIAGATAVPIDEVKNVRRAIRIRQYPADNRGLFWNFAQLSRDGRPVWSFAGKPLLPTGGGGSVVSRVASRIPSPMGSRERC